VFLRPPLIRLLLLIPPLGAVLAGCAAIEPPTRCRCGKCQQEVVGPQDMLGDLAQTFDRLVVGTAYEDEPLAEGAAEALPPTEPESLPLRRGQHSASRDRQVAEVVTPSDVSPTITVDTPPADRPQSPPVVNATPEADFECGPPPRFFPVPARPVFSNPTLRYPLR
jgi:hypothetical protein